MRDFLTDEDFGADPVSPETLEKIQASIYVLESVLLSPVSAPEDDIRIDNIEISDTGESISVAIVPEQDDSPYGIIVYKPKSEKYIMENLLGALRYWLDDSSSVDFNVYVHGIKRQYVTLPDRSSIDSASLEEAYRHMAEKAQEFIRKQKEAEAFMEMTGMDFVSEKTAKQILQVLHRYEDFISIALFTK